MKFHPTAKPEFVRHVTARLEKLRTELPQHIPSTHPAFVLEIGCGHGHFLTRYAAENPAKFCLGVDLIKDRLQRSRRKHARAAVTNLHFHQAEARELLMCLPPGLKLTEVFLLFPDPWPKKRHHKNRLVRREFLELLADHMAPQGRFFFRTDHAEYFESGHAVVAAHPRWKLLPEAAWPLEEATIFQLKAPSYSSLIAETRPAG